MTDLTLDFIKERNDLREKIERLREALKIFGAYADYLDEDYGDYPDHHVSKAFGGNILVFGDFRKARAALKEET